MERNILWAKTYCTHVILLLMIFSHEPVQNFALTSLPYNNKERNTCVGSMEMMLLLFYKLQHQTQRRLYAPHISYTHQHTKNVKMHVAHTQTYTQYVILSNIFEKLIKKQTFKSIAINNMQILDIKIIFHPFVHRTPRVLLLRYTRHTHTHWVENIHKYGEHILNTKNIHSIW